MPTFEVVQDPEVVRLVRFSTGVLNPDVKKEIDFKCYNDISNKRKLAVTTKINNIEYSGENFGQSNSFSSENCDYYVAVQRKGSDKVQILPAELFSLHPKTEENGQSSENELKERDDFRRYAEKSRLLTAQFGSGTAQKQMKKAIDQRVDNQAMGLMSQSVPASATSDVSTPGTQSNTVQSAVIPPHNKDATKPEDVYLLETTVPDWVMDPLREQSQVFVNCTAEDIANWRKDDKKIYSSVILNHLEKLPLSTEERQWKCCLIMYLHCLIFTYNLRARDLAGVNHFPSDWKGLVKKLLDDSFSVCSSGFSGRPRRTRPAHLRDLILSHIFILNLRLNDYSFLLQPLVNDLKLSLKRTMLHATTLGLTVSGKADKLVKLTTPFKLPPPTVKSKSRGK